MGQVKARAGDQGCRLARRLPSGGGRDRADREASGGIHRTLPVSGPVALALFLVFLPAVLAAADFPVTVKDAWGHELRLDRAPRRIVSLSLQSDEELFELLDPSRILALSTMADLEGISSIRDKAGQVKLRVAGEKEKIVALQPDLVLVASWKEADFVQALRDVGIKVFVMQAPVDFIQLKSGIRDLARLLGERTRGETLVADIDRRLDQVRQSLAGLPVEQRLTVLSYNSYGSTYGKHTSFDALVEAAGLRNAASLAGLEGWPQISRENILVMDPDLVLLPSWSWDPAGDPQAFARSFRNDPVYGGIKAVRNHRVLTISDALLQSNSHFMVQAVEELARLAYPAVFGVRGK